MTYPDKEACERTAEKMMNDEQVMAQILDEDKFREIFQKPKDIAFKDYRKGGGHADNPFVPGSFSHEEYMWEMNRLYNEELKTIRAELAGGV